MGNFSNFSGIKSVGGHRYVLAAALTFDLGYPGSPYIYVTPSGFEFDVSIPVGLRWLFNRDDIRYLRAAAIHDHMLIAGWDRQTAAAVFYRALRASDVPAWRSVTMFLGVSAYSLTFTDQTSKKDSDNG